MRLHREARKFYVLGVSSDPAVAGTWQASFDEGVTWVNGRPDVEGEGGVLGWGWLVAGPGFTDDPDGLDTGDTDATVSKTMRPLLRVKEDPSLEIEPAPTITVWS